MQKLKSFLGTYLRNPWILFVLFFSFMTGMMLFDHIRKQRARLPADLAFSQVWDLVAANIHWVLAITVSCAFFYTMAVSLAFRPAEGERSLGRHVRLWLLLSMGGAALQFLHGNFILPGKNAETRAVRRELDPFANPGKEGKKPMKSAREMGMGELRAALAKAGNDIDRLKSRIARDSGESRERWERGVERREKWIITLHWEMAKKIQMALYWILLAPILLAWTLFVRRIPWGILRFLAAYLFCRLLLVVQLRGMLWTANRLDAGAPHYNAFTAWLIFGCFGLLAFAAAITLWRRFRNAPPEPEALPA